MRPRCPSMLREESMPSLPTIRSVKPIPEIPINATAQKQATSEIVIAEKKLIESEQIYNITTDPQLRHDIYKKIVDLRTQIKSN